MDKFRAEVEEHYNVSLEGQAIAIIKSSLDLFTVAPELRSLLSRDEASALVLYEDNNGFVNSDILGNIEEFITAGVPD